MEKSITHDTHLQHMRANYASKYRTRKISRNYIIFLNFYKQWYLKIIQNLAKFDFSNLQFLVHIGNYLYLLVAEQLNFTPQDHLNIANYVVNSDKLEQLEKYELELVKSIDLLAEELFVPECQIINSSSDDEEEELN